MKSALVIVNLFHFRTYACRMSQKESKLIFFPFLLTIVHFYPGSPVYDSLLTRRTFIPSFRMVLLELSLMTLGVFVMSAVEVSPKNYFLRALGEEGEEKNSGKNKWVDREIIFSAVSRMKTVDTFILGLDVMVVSF